MASTLTAGSTGAETLTALNEIIGEVNAAELRRKWDGAKMVVFGDSIWNQSTIQPYLVTLLGVDYNATEMSTGTGGYKPTAYPGSTITGYSDLGVVGDNSLYRRADDVHQYSPDLILICGGSNDNALSSWASSPYTLTDEVYTGASFTTVGYAGAPSYVSCFKGMMKKLVENNPSAKIIFMGRYEYETSKSSEANFSKLVDRSNADKYCCQWAGVHFIDALQIGVCSYNATTYMSGLAHPNSTGGALMAYEFAKVASMI